MTNCRFCDINHIIVIYQQVSALRDFGFSRINSYERSFQPDPPQIFFWRVRLSGKATTTDPLSIMRKLIFTITCLLLLTACENAPAIRKAEQNTTTRGTVSNVSLLDQEIQVILEKGISMSERKRQVASIEASFLRRSTTPERARQLAALCFTKTLGTPFIPFDLAEIALTETGGHKLSATAVSTKGALGVWQLMPSRVKSHGYSLSEMKNDEKCAEAAVRELYSKLAMARGNLEYAKKLYCGQGPEAEYYMRRILKIRQEMQAELKHRTELLAMGENEIRIR